MRKFSVAIVIVLYSWTLNAQSNPQVKTNPPLIIIPEAKYLTYVVNIGINQLDLTGFLYATNDGKYLLITAKHMFNKKYSRPKIIGRDTTIIVFDSLMVKNGDSIDFRINTSQGWKALGGRVYFHQNPDVDIAVIRQYRITLDSSNYILDPDGSFYGQDCFFPGFPLGITMSRVSENLNFKLPIIKKGIISGMTETKNKAITFLIDGNNTYGLSGSPVLFYDYKLKKFKVLGVISRYLAQTDVTYDNHGKPVLQEENSGIFEAFSIQYVKEIISNLK